MTHIEIPEVEQLIDEAGQPKFGVFSQLKQLNYLDYHSHLLSQKPVAQWRKQLKINQFAFIQLRQSPYRICLALATIKLATTAFVYVYNERTGEIEVVEALQPLMRHSQFDGDHRQGQMRFKHPSLSLQLQFTPESVQLHLACQQFDLTAECQRCAHPLAMCSPSGRRGWSFTQKEPLTMTAGKLTFTPSSKHFALSSQHSQSDSHNQVLFTTQGVANLDWTLGAMRHETNWFWSCINSELADGRHFMLNLSMGVNETGVSENACWIDGRLYYLPPVLFTRPEVTSSQHKLAHAIQDQAQDAWHIRNQNLGWSRVSVELTFVPITVYKKTDNYRVIASVFEQWIGFYSGQIHIRSESGDQVVILDKVMGLAEDHFAKW